MESPIHEFFGLSYANYFVMQRRLLEEMPYEWQKQFVDLVNQIGDTFDMEYVPQDFEIKAKAENGQYIHDPYSEYRHPMGKVPRKEKHRNQ